MSKNKKIKTDTKEVISFIGVGWGELAVSYAVGSLYCGVKIARIEKEQKMVGVKFSNDMTTVCYVVYSKNGSKLVELNEGSNLEIRYSVLNGEV